MTNPTDASAARGILRAKADGAYRGGKRRIDYEVQRLVVEAPSDLSNDSKYISGLKTAFPLPADRGDESNDG